MKILLAVDGSPYTKKMLAYLTTHPETFVNGHSFTALTVENSLPASTRDIVGKDVVDRFHEESAQQVLAPISKFFAQHDIPLQTVFEVGSAGEAIAQFAEEGRFDLVIMGSHGKSALGNLFLGSVATKVLANCQVPVLVVR